MAEKTGGRYGLVVIVVILAAAVAVLAYMWWQEEESDELEIEIGSGDSGAAVERGGALAAVPPPGVVFRRT